MKKITFFARNKETGKAFAFTLDDLYGYEGEKCGVFIRSVGIALNFNSGYGFDGMNPQLELYDVQVEDG